MNATEDMKAQVLAAASRLLGVFGENLPIPTPLFWRSNVVSWPPCRLPSC